MLSFNSLTIITCQLVYALYNYYYVAILPYLLITSYYNSFAQTTFIHINNIIILCKHVPNPHLYYYDMFQNSYTLGWSAAADGEFMFSTYNSACMRMFRSAALCKRHRLYGCRERTGEFGAHTCVELYPDYVTKPIHSRK